MVAPLCYPVANCSQSNSFGCGVIGNTMGFGPIFQSSNLCTRAFSDAYYPDTSGSIPDGTTHGPRAGAHTPWIRLVLGKLFGSLAHQVEHSVEARCGEVRVFQEPLTFRSRMLGSQPGVGVPLGFKVAQAKGFLRVVGRQGSHSGPQ